MNRKTARLYRLDRTKHGRQDAMDDGDDDAPRPVTKGRPPKIPRKSSKNRLPACLFSVEEESPNNKDPHEDASHHDDSPKVQAQESRHDATSSVTPLANPTPHTTTSSSTNRSRGCDDRSHDVSPHRDDSCPLQAGRFKKSTSTLQQDCFESPFLHNTLSPILDHTPSPIPFTATDLQQFSFQEKDFFRKDQVQEHAFVEHDEMTKSGPTPECNNSSSSDWLAIILERLPLSFERDLTREDDVRCLSTSSTLEPRSLEEMSHYPIPIEESWLSSREYHYSN